MPRRQVGAFFLCQQPLSRMGAMWKFGTRSKNNMKGVNPDLIGIAYRALMLSPHDFGIIEGVRTLERQKQLFQDGASKTMNSRHLTGGAIDFAVYKGGKLVWDFPLYQEVSESFKRAAAEMGLKITWGGDWPKFRDGPHIQLEA